MQSERVVDPLPMMHLEEGMMGLSLMSIMLMVPLEKVKHHVLMINLSPVSHVDKGVMGPNLESESTMGSSKEAIQRTHARIKEKAEQKTVSALFQVRSVLNDHQRGHQKKAIKRDHLSPSDRVWIQINRSNLKVPRKKQSKTYSVSVVRSIPVHIR